jgi:hypothetical protein
VAKTQAIQTKPENDLALPAYAGSVDGRANTAAADNQAKPRIKIVQGSSKPDLKKKYGEGAVLLSSDDVCLGKAEVPFTAVPLFLYETWEIHADVNDKQARTMVMETTTDQRSAVARFCSGPDRKSRERPYDNGFVARGHHILNAVLAFDDGQFGVASWKINGGGSRSGKKFAGIIARREQSGVWCYMNRLAFKSALVEVNDQAWWTLTADNPESNPFIAETDIPKYKAMHDQLERMHTAGGIAVQAETAEDAADDLPV